MVNENDIKTDIIIRVWVDDILDMAINDTVLRFQAIPDSAGANQAADHAITRADRDWFVKKLRLAADKVFNALVAFSKHTMTYVDPEVTTPRERILSYQFNTLNPDDNRDIISWQIKVGENYDPNLNDTIVSHIEDCLASFCLYEWYKIKGMTPDSIDKFDNHTQRLKDIKSILNYRITPVTRPYVGI